MGTIERIHELVSRLGCEVRIKVKDELSPALWSNWISEPSPGYIETFTAGPWPSCEVEWIDINPIATIHIGRLVKDKYVDYREDMVASLTSTAIPFELLDDVIRVKVEK